MGCSSSAEDGDLFSSNEHNSKNKKNINSNNNSNRALHYDSSKTPENKNPNKKKNSVNNVINMEDEDRFESSKSSIDEQEELKYENKVLEISKNSSELSSHSEEKAN